MRGLDPKGPLSGVLHPPKIESGYGPGFVLIQSHYTTNLKWLGSSSLFNAHNQNKSEHKSTKNQQLIWINFESNKNITLNFHNSCSVSYTTYINWLYVHISYVVICT